MKALPIGSRTAWTRYNGAAASICLAALQRAPLALQRQPDGRRTHYAYRGRLFNPDTVNALITAGLAERQGDKVVARA